jgi:hypothetical protein
MQVWVQTEVLPPGVQNGDHTCLCTQELMVVAKATDDLPGGGKKGAVKMFWGVERQFVEFLWQGEDHVKIRHVQEFGLTRLHPLLAFMSLAFGTMAVAATVVAQVEFTAAGMVALVYVPAQCRGPAPAQCVEGAQLPTVVGQFVQLVCVAFQHLCHFIAWLHGLLGIEFFQRRECPVFVQVAHVEVNQGGLYIDVAQKVFEGHNVEAHFQEVGGIGVAQHVGGDFFFDATSLSGLSHDPLHTPRGEGHGPSFFVIAVEAPGGGLFSNQVFFKSADEHITKGHIPVLSSFALTDVQHLAVKVQVLEPEVSHFPATKATAIEQTEHHAVFEQFWGFQQQLDFFTAQDHGQLFWAFYTGQYHFQGFYITYFAGIAKAINGMLEETIGWGAAMGF